MQIQSTSKSAPLFMKSHDMTPVVDIVSVEGRDFVYDPQTQTANWLSCDSPTGYYTNGGQDYTKTDETYIDPHGPN